MISGLKSLFSRGETTRSRHDLAPGMRVYAIGDVHGQDDLLDMMLGRIRADVEATGHGVQSTLIMMGDYVDRGLGSARVIERLSTLQGMPFSTRFLKGNHEAAMLDFLDDAETGPVWVQYGGGETLASYGVQPPSPQDDAPIWHAAQAALLEALPDHHAAFLDALEPFVVEPPYIFVHAGVDPAKPLAEQTDQDLFWIRDKFLYSQRKFEHIVVHGHTPEPEPFHDDRRIGIDTGAYLSGVLTAVRLEGASVSFLQSRRGDR